MIALAPTMIAKGFAPLSGAKVFVIMETPRVPSAAAQLAAANAARPKNKPLVRKAGARQRLVLGERQVTFTWMV